MNTRAGKNKGLVLEKWVAEMLRMLFQELEEDDILFIDSSHIYHHGSDVDYLVGNILPKLNQGVNIHFHDYFDTDGYPEDWKNYPNMREWNESDYLVEIKDKYKVLAINHLISKYNNEELKKQYPFVPTNITKNFGAVKGTSLWLRK